MQHHIKPAASEARIEIKGWHTLRHPYTRRRSSEVTQ
jgi:hypothetical protein